MYDLNEVRTFVSVMETGNLKESALRLGVSKSTLSRRISHLEQALSQPLLRRQANRLIANEAGVRFLPFAQKLLRTADEGHKAVETLKEEVSGSIVMYVHTSLAQSWFSKLVGDFLAAFPHIHLDIRVGQQPLREVKHHDLCLWVGDGVHDQLKSEKIATMSQSLYAGASYFERIGSIKDLNTLKRCSWVNSFHGHQDEVLLEHAELGRVLIPLPPSRLLVNQYELYVEDIIQGRGVGLLPNYFVTRLLQQRPGAVLPVLSEWTANPLPVYLQYPFGSMSKKLHTFIQYLRRHAQALG